MNLNLCLLFQRRVLKMHNDYYYTDIKGTPFRWGGGGGVHFPLQ